MSGLDIFQSVQAWADFFTKLIAFKLFNTDIKHSTLQRTATSESLSTSPFSQIQHTIKTLLATSCKLQWNRDFSNLQGKQKFVPEIGKFEKSRVKMYCWSKELKQLLVQVIGSFEKLMVREIGIPLYTYLYTHVHRRKTDDVYLQFSYSRDFIKLPNETVSDYLFAIVPVVCILRRTFKLRDGNVQLLRVCWRALWKQ